MLPPKTRWILPAVLLLVLFAVLSACAPAAPTAAPAPTVQQAPTVVPIPSLAPTATTEATSAPTTAPTSAPTTAATVAAAPSVAPTTGVSGAAAIPEITVNAVDFSFTAPDLFPAGLVKVKLVNQGQEPHHAQFLRLNDNVTLAQFQQALPQGEQAVLSLVTLAGGVGALNPGLSGEIILNVTPGNYVLACFISSADGIPHLAKGMLRPIQVTAASTSTTTPSVTADVDVTLRDFTIDMPSTLKAGMTTFKITNQGPEFHEWNIFQLADGKTMADIMAFFGAPPGSVPSGPPPFAAVGGMNGLSKDTFGYVQMDLKPGNYIAICNIPSFANGGKPHSELGMMKEFTVQ